MADAGPAKCLADLQQIGKSVHLTNAQAENTKPSKASAISVKISPDPLKTKNFASRRNALKPKFSTSMESAKTAPKTKFHKSSLTKMAKTAHNALILSVNPMK